MDLSTKFLTKIFFYLPLVLFLGLLVLVCFYSSGPKMFLYQFNAIDMESILQAPSGQHWFGTDALGRDLFVRVVHGARTSLAIAFVTTVMTLLIGILFGTLAGYCGGIIDLMIMKFIDFVYSLPDLLVLSLIALFFSRSTNGIVLGLAFIFWLDLARLVRAEVISLKQREFVEASYSLGLDHSQILLRHILPNIFPLILASISVTVPRAILAESTLSFIGLGVSPPDTSWGTLAGDAWTYLRTDPHLIFFPALMIFFVVYSFRALGKNLLRS